ncbi:sigma-54 dependent transcriptional regulator [Desulfovibrio subterraneus]|jgi:DNA-binding NtrC family response regulator|uniref:sigma-54-dependent transcriptional regulator n=1 Tax=Desulfovibrio subterraneus TaxID=2718620 RepID=UPI0022B8C3DF|nr:sigma-54 dependent transcriptional regulator [Desulfovibrio subterraneus]WBF68582.1 sigma-54 dependent transcriptional regulator [Desulfovibrio subterraneus]
MSPRRILFLAPAASVTHIFPRLKDAGYEVGLAENLKGASAFIRKSGPSVIFSRPQLPGYKVDDLLAVSQDDASFPPVIVFSDKGSVEEAERLLNMGAQDYWLEPLIYDKVIAAVPAGRKSIPAPAVTTLGGRKPQMPETGKGPNIIGSNPVMRRVLALAKQVAPSRATVLISGESGTGKEMFSKFLHVHSDRGNGPFVAVNCAALPEHLLESELFGHEKGAFTGAINRKLGKFELASGGTILLDEISEMDLGLQAKLLRVLQESELDRVGGTETVKVDVRVLATTNRNLEDWVKEGKFRQDLYFRLNVIPLRLPALRERGEDVLALARFFVDMYVREYGLAHLEFSQEALDWLVSYDWPGNVRELQNLMERATLLAGRGPISKNHFLLDPDSWPLFGEDEDQDAESAASGGMADSAGPVASGAGMQTASGTAVPGGDGSALFAQGVIPLHEMERIMILKGLEQTSGNRTQAAEMLGISVRTLRNKLNEYRGEGLDIP